MWFAGPAARVPAAGRPSVLRLGFDLKPGMRVGLFGGSFNPAHEGHAHVADTALRRLRLDRVIWLVSPQNPLKPTHETTALTRRVWGALRFAQGPSMLVSDAETRIGSFYTIDTLRVLRARYPGVCFVWIMGADSLASFHRWRGWTQIMREMPVAVVSRPWTGIRSRFSPAARRFAWARIRSRAASTLPCRKPPAWVYLTAPLNFASSTALRRSRDEVGAPLQIAR
ncbi:MAG TPA: nicotinate-nucleotide adenylyltransferase [Caulobacteraceae bacterium]|nr:nicotinate-nucleotide adenylyltransferase [Caulobacteraceae bacterium]